MTDLKNRSIGASQMNEDAIKEQLLADKKAAKGDKVKKEEVSKFRKVLTFVKQKVKAVVTDERVVLVTKVADSIFDIAARFGQAKLGGPAAYIGAALSAVENIRYNLDLEGEDEVTDYLENKVMEDGLIERDSFLGDLLMETDSFHILKTETKVESRDGRRRVVSVTDEENKILLLVVAGGSGDGPQKPKKKADKASKSDNSTREYIERRIYVEEGFDFSILSEAVWKAMGSRFLKAVGMGYTVKLVPVEENDPDYVGEHSPAAFAETIKKYHDRNISRGALLYGPPGSGKTTFVRAYANHIKGRLLIIPPETLNSDCRSDVEMFVNLLIPEVLLIDDIDHARSGLNLAMTMVVDVRRKYPKMVVVTTANDLSRVKSALLRPGRLGERLRFDAPSEEDKKTVLILYMTKQYGVNPADFEIDVLISKMAHENFTHDYVRFIAEQAVVMNQEELVDCIETIVEFLEEDEDNYSPSDGERNDD